MSELTETIADYFGLFDTDELADELKALDSATANNMIAARKALSALSTDSSGFAALGFDPDAITAYEQNIINDVKHATQARNMWRLANKELSPFFNSWLMHWNHANNFHALITAQNAGHNTASKIYKQLKLATKLLSNEFNRTIPFMWQMQQYERALLTVKDTDSSAFIRAQANTYNAIAKAKSDWRRVMQNAKNSTIIKPALRKEQPTGYAATYLDDTPETAKAAIDSPSRYAATREKHHKIKTIYRRHRRLK